MVRLRPNLLSDRASVAGGCVLERVASFVWFSTCSFRLVVVSLDRTLGFCLRCQIQTYAFYHFWNAVILRWNSYAVAV